MLALFVCVFKTCFVFMLALFVCVFRLAWIHLLKSSRKLLMTCTVLKFCVYYMNRLLRLHKAVFGVVAKSITIKSIMRTKSVL